ncbi:MAG: STAS domain-containing protein [Casimicrobiaceae bacterium]
MALFSKPPAKKPTLTRPEPKLRAAAPGARPPSAREVVKQIAGRAAEAPTTSAPFAPSGDRVVGRPAMPAISLDSSSNGLCGALENAALLFASNQAAPARAMLEGAVVEDPEARESALAWLSLFDLLCRAGDRASFDRLALQYVVQFERSAPSWEELGAPGPGRRDATRAGTIALTGVLTDASAPQIDALHRLGDGAREATLDLSAVTDCDDAGAHRLAAALAGARRRRVGLAIARSEGLRERLQRRANEGREAGEGAWLLLLELLQWHGEQPTFDDRAVEFAVTFEVSPPSWEPPLPQAPPPPKRPSRSRGDMEAIAWSGEVKGPSPEAVAQLLEFAQPRSSVLLDMAQVERIDFVAGGALANAVQRLETKQKTVQIVGATPIVRALLLLVGISVELFARKAA